MAISSKEMRGRWKVPAGTRDLKALLKAAGFVQRGSRWRSDSLRPLADVTKALEER